VGHHWQGQKKMNHQKACQIRYEITGHKKVHKKPFMNGREDAKKSGCKPRKAISHGKADGQVVPA
jgi:hypothetical protein